MTKRKYQATTVKPIAKASTFDPIYLRINGKTLIRSEVEKLTLDDDTKSIDAEQFSYTGNLKSINIPKKCTLINKFAFQYSCIESIVIPPSVKRIGTAAFRNCKQLKTVIISEGVTEIDYFAFDSCSSITFIKIPSSLTSISNSCFHKCSGLVSVRIPNTIETIEDRALYSCKNLTEITVPLSVKSIGERSFENCERLKILSTASNMTVEQLIRAKPGPHSVYGSEM